MPYKWNPGWRGPALVAFFVFSSALALFVRRKWRLAEIRRAEVKRLVRLAVAEAERAEKEAAAFVYEVEKQVSAVVGGGVGIQNCAVCQSPTTTRCSRCKAVRYCSGNCQITHWRQGHKYDCHPPLINDHCNNLPNVPAMKGDHVEKPDSDNDLGVEGKGHSTIDVFYVDQSVSNLVGPQSKPSIMVDSKSQIEVKPSDIKPLETLLTIPVSSISNLSSEIHSENGEDSEKHFIITSENGASSISGMRSSSSSCSTISGPVEMMPFSSSNDDLTRASSGHNSNTNAHDNLEESSSRHSSERLRTSLTDSDQAKLSTSAHVTEVSDSASYSSLSSDLKTDSTSLINETEFKVNASSKLNLSSPIESNVARICKDAIEFCHNPGKSKTSISSEVSCEGQGETLDSSTVETVTCIDSTVSQSFSSIHHPQLDKGCHSELVDKLSGTISGSKVASQGRSDFKEAVIIEKSGVVTRESNVEPLKSSSPSCLTNHSALKSHGQTLLRNGSLKVENISPVSSKSIKVDGSLPIGKDSSKKTVQLVTSSSLLRRSQSGLSNKGYGKFNYKMLFPYDNFIRLYNSDKVEMHPCGLVNCGNSCYVNAVLQCFSFTRPLAAFILEGLHAKACSKKGWCFTCEFEALLIKAKQGKSPVSPTSIISHIHDIGSNFGQGREEDAHEFLRYSIDAMQSACLKEAGASADSELAEETTLIQLIFGGYLRSKIKCIRCHGKSERRERMMDLTVDIHGDIGTLEEALARFTTSEILDGENKYRCDRCKSFERAKKQLTILEAPNVLTIALKRYQSGRYGKLNKTVHFPEYLNLAPYMRGSDDNSPVYRLYAVVVHNGHMNATFSGHYVCYVKNTQGKWFIADDSKVKQVEVHQVLSQDAYMLLYARCSPRAPSLLRKEMTKNLQLKEREHVQNSTTRSRLMFLRPGNQVNQNHTGDSTNFEPHDLFDERFRRPNKVDSSSDCSSLFSCSDEGSSWSTESTKDSVTSEEFSDNPLGESAYVNSAHIDESGYSNSVSSEENGFRGRESMPFLYSIKHYNNLTEQCSSRNSADWVNSSEPKSGVLFRRSSGDRRAQTFY